MENLNIMDNLSETLVNYCNSSIDPECFDKVENKSKCYFREELRIEFIKILVNSHLILLIFKDIFYLIIELV